MYLSNINNQISNYMEEKVMSESKERNWHMIYRSIIGGLSLIIMVGVIYYIINYKRDVKAANEEYKAAKIEYNKAYERVVEEEKAWEKELIATHKEAIEMATELSEIYKARQEEKNAEDKRWSSLSKEEQMAEKRCIAYNEMVSYLRANNKEYAKLYTQYATYLDQDIFNLDSEALLDYTDMYSRKVAIEKQYMGEHPF